MAQYLARLTWNTNQWKRPSGTGGETNSYVAQNGFGHEEWLNRGEWIVNGWCYGFIQGVSKARARLQGQTIDVRLFTLDPEKRRFYVGELNGAEVIDDAAHRRVVAAFRRTGYLDQMLAEIRAVGGNDEAFMRYLPHGGLANVKFRSDDLKLYESPVPVQAGDRLLKLNRYMLYEARPQLVRQWNERIRRAAAERPKDAIERRRAGIPPVLVDPVENRMQNELLELLRATFGSANVKSEQDYVDISVLRNGRRALLEIKSCDDARLAIRNAIGQLLEYGFYREPPDDPELFVVAPAVLHPAAATYLQRLNERFRLNIQYRQYRMGSRQFRM